ncbi:MAG TPA: multidrug efflux SMR transporter [Alphaproteobacteria bacterium]|nr:multidrug efflux SMR transporter [Alphaproteobacteria bacterium]
MAWLWVLFAGLAEIGWMTCLKLSAGFTKWSWLVAALLVSFVSVGLMALAVQKLPMGTAYAIWTGMGAAGIALVGILFFGEPRTMARIAFIACVVVGIAGLKLTASE